MHGKDETSEHDIRMLQLDQCARPYTLLQEPYQSLLIQRRLRIVEQVPVPHATRCALYLSEAAQCSTPQHNEEWVA